MTELKTLKNTRHHADHANADSVGATPGTTLIATEAFRFTGSRALYVECDVHMCHSSCPTQQCSWRQRRKRSAVLEGNDTATPFETLNLFQALEVLHTDADAQQSLPYSDPSGSLVCLKATGFASRSCSDILDDVPYVSDYDNQPPDY
ncbi:hypothetical protein MRX96_011354 [Rhipicephalus microplus]